MNPLLYSVVLSLLPIAELRGGIPYAVANDISLPVAYLVCVASNILVIPALFIFLDTLHHQLYKIGPYKWLFDKMVIRTLRKAETKVGKYGYWGVMLFVAIPLPVTGAYTGTLAAWLLELNKRKAFWYLALGVVIAGVIVSVATLTGVGILRIFTK
ncbi:MAG: small multi-drug export protein [candidate division Zixibacteria bacterium]|nr:small multi-drug export protein [candidate division Zixibacteria bacterium]MBU1470479.1 small multi-drug export protein [candidate division Zixibacteria bacterium]MBU2625928.1 small multi-drug export protein [candidate division Zixibacteria bacterium]